MASIQVQGLKELQSGLKKLDGNMAKELNKVAKSAAAIVVVEAKALAPKITGRLAGKITPIGTTKGGFVKVGGLPYHRVIHFGWARHNISPQPFLYDARDARYAAVIEQFEREVATLVNKVV